MTGDVPDQIDEALLEARIAQAQRLTQRALAKLLPHQPHFFRAFEQGMGTPAGERAGQLYQAVVGLEQADRAFQNAARERR